MNNTIKYQNYLHFKLPITINPLEYGKLNVEIGNKYVLQLNNTNVLFITQIDDTNFVKFFRKGELMFEFKDSKISERSFIRTLKDQKYTFENNRLISTEIMILASNILIYKNINSNLTNPCNNTFWQNYKTVVLIIFYIILGLYFIFLDEIIPGDFVIVTSLAAFSTYNTIKLRKTKSIHVWKTMEFKLNNLLFTKDLFESKLNKFWIKNSPEFTDNNHMFILFKVKYKGSDYATIGNLQRLNIADKDWYLSWILNNMILKSEYYNETSLESFIFSYGFKNEKISNKEIIKTIVNFQKYKNNKLVISYNPLDYGELIIKNEFDNYTQFVLQNNDNLLIKINKFDKYNEVNLISSGKTILKFKDELISKNKFVRILDSKKFYFENNKEVLFIKEMKTKFISKISDTKLLKNEFITLDIETFIKDSILIVYCISIFDGKSKTNFYLTDFKNVEELIIAALKSIMIRKYNGYNVYMHNMAKFDIIFLLKYLVKLGTVHPIIHNDRIISINFNFGPDNKYQLLFKDSYLLLLNSLMKLCKSFKVENAKSIFPIFFVNENNLDYIGEVPDIKYFKDINLKDYENYRSKFKGNWDLKNEVVKYCNLDCISLYQVIHKFTEMIFELFRKNVHHYPTLPSLAFAIFRSKFMIKENIPQLSGKIANDIRSGYTGGSCDVFIPQSKPNIKTKSLDVNSLYPSQMFYWPMPVGVPTYFKGDIRKTSQNAFGFFYCEIIAPDDIKHPILQTHVKTNNGIRTISPIGTWEDMIFSTEMDNAMKFGYKFEILWGYTFNKENIFANYVDYLFNLRSQYDKSNPMNFIAKILMNSLYGRFGMDDNFAEINIIHKDFYPDFENKFIDDIISSTDLGEYKLVTYKQDKTSIEDEASHNISIGVAAAITAYSRIHMTQFKNKPGITLYYTDTDSIYVDEDSDIPENLIDNKLLGKLKLENIYKKAIFIAPKVYCLETENQERIYKVKGLKHEIELTMGDFEKLLYKESILEKFQTKFMKNLSGGNIKLLEQIYTLQVTDNKRKLI